MSEVKTDEQGARFLSLFTAEPPVALDGTEAPLVDEWAFVPVGDIFLVVGEAIVGITAEGLGADAKPGHDRMSFSEAISDKKPKVKARGRGRPHHCGMVLRRWMRRRRGGETGAGREIEETRPTVGEVSGKVMDRTASRVMIPTSTGRRQRGCRQLQEFGGL